MKRAAVMTGDVSSAIQESLGNYWVMRTTTYPYKNKQWKDAWENAVVHYRKAQKITKGKNLKLLQKRVGEFLKQYYPNEDMEWDA